MAQLFADVTQGLRRRLAGTPFGKRAVFAAPSTLHSLRGAPVAPMTQDDPSSDSQFAMPFEDSRLGLPGGNALGVADPNAGWIVCQGVEGFASLQEGVRRARAAVERGDASAMQPVPEPVGNFVKDWMAKRHAASAHPAAQTVFVLDDASRIWASRLITYLSQAADASSQRLHFLHRTIAGATVSLAQVCLSSGQGGANPGPVGLAGQGDKHVYWADARGRSRASHEVRDAFSANGDVLAMLIGPMSANAFEKVSSMLRGQWELRRGSLQRVVLLVSHDAPPPRQAVDALLEDFAGAAQAAYVNLSDAGQCWQALLAASQGLPPRKVVAGVMGSAETTQMPTQIPDQIPDPIPDQRPAPIVAANPAPPVQAAPTAQAPKDSPALDLLDLYAGGDGLRSVALFTHQGDLVVQRVGTSGAGEAQSGSFFADELEPNQDGLQDNDSNEATAGADPADVLRRTRQGQALRAVLGASGLRPPRRWLLESAEAFDIVEPLAGMPTLWLWSHFDAKHMATTHAQALSSRLAFDLAQLLAAHDDPLSVLAPARASPPQAHGDSLQEAA
jgi:hypothetical protein